MTRPHVHWRKSSHSAQEGNCVEVGAWCKSSRSGEQGNCIEVGTCRKSNHSAQQDNCVKVSGTWSTSSHSTEEGHCVEVAADETLVLARDSKDPDGPVLGFGTDAWHAFLTTAKTGRLDLH